MNEIFLRDFRFALTDPRFGIFADNIQAEQATPNQPVHLTVRRGRFALVDLSLPGEEATALFGSLARIFTLNGEELYLGSSLARPTYDFVVRIEPKDVETVRATVPRMRCLVDDTFYACFPTLGELRTLIHRLQASVAPDKGRTPRLVLP